MIKSLLKTYREKEKMLVTNIFSFSHNVFYPSQNEFQIVSQIYFVVCKCSEFGHVYRFCRLVTSKPLIKGQSSRIQSICIGKRKCISKLKVELEGEKNFMGKKANTSYTEVFHPFKPTIFSKPSLLA